MLDRINEAVKYINDLLPEQPEYIVVLGSGLGKLEDKVENKVVINYKDIPNFPQVTVEGHKGHLVYGTILGKMAGDTLRANYTFMSEGKESNREVVFLRKGKIMIEAYGDVEEKEGKTVFKEPKKLYFDSATVLSEIDCPQPK